MREALLGHPRFEDHIKRFIESGIGLLHRNAEAGEFVVPIAFADAEIEPAAGEKIDGRGLLGKEHRIVPRQHQNRRAKAERSRFRRDPGQQRQACRDLAEPGEMMLNEKGGMITERLGLNIVFDELAITLARIRVGAAMAGRGAAEQTEAHEGLSYFAAFLLCRANVAHGRRRELEHDPEKWLPVFGKDHAQTKM